MIPDKETKIGTPINEYIITRTLPNGVTGVISPKPTVAIVVVQKYKESKKLCHSIIEKNHAPTRRKMTIKETSIKKRLPKNFLPGETALVITSDFVK
jgi:hypothetical protein